MPACSSAAVLSTQHSRSCAVWSLTDLYQSAPSQGHSTMPTPCNAAQHGAQQAPHLQQLLPAGLALRSRQGGDRVC